MSDEDIVLRLRWLEQRTDGAPTIRDAANEIERLRAEVDDAYYRGRDDGYDAALYGD